MAYLAVEFAPTYEDFQEAIRLFTIKANENIWWKIGLIYLPVSILNVWLSIQNNFDASTFNLIFFFILIAIPSFIYIRIYRNSSLAARQQIGNMTLLSKTSWIMGDRELAVKNPDLDVKMAWDFFHTVMESDLYYFLVYRENKNCFQLLPKHAFLKNSDENEFRKILEAKIGKIKPIKVGAQYRISMIIFAVIAFLNIAFLFYANFQNI